MTSTRSSVIAVLIVTLLAICHGVVWAIIAPQPISLICSMIGGYLLGFLYMPISLGLDRFFND